MFQSLISLSTVCERYLPPIFKELLTTTKDEWYEYVILSQEYALFYFLLFPKALPAWLMSFFKED